MKQQEQQELADASTQHAKIEIEENKAKVGKLAAAGALLAAGGLFVFSPLIVPAVALGVVSGVGQSIINDGQPLRKRPYVYEH